MVSTVHSVESPPAVRKIQSISPFGPLTKPSNEIDIFNISFLIAASIQYRYFGTPVLDDIFTYCGPGGVAGRRHGAPSTLKRYHPVRTKGAADRRIGGPAIGDRRSADPYQEDKKV